MAISFQRMKYGTLVTTTLAAIITAGYVWMGNEQASVSPTDYYELFQGVQERLLATVYDDTTTATISREIQQGQWYVDELGRTWKEIKWDNTLGKMVTNTYPYFTNRLVEYRYTDWPYSEEDPYIAWINRVVTNTSIEKTPSYWWNNTAIFDYRVNLMYTTNKYIYASNEVTGAITVSPCWTNIATTNFLGNYIGDEYNYALMVGSLMKVAGAYDAFNNNYSVWVDPLYEGAEGVGRYDGLDGIPFLSSPGNPRYTMREMFTRLGIIWDTGQNYVKFNDVDINAWPTQHMITVSNWVEKYMVTRECKWMDGSGRVGFYWDSAAPNYIVYAGEGSTWAQAKANISVVYSEAVRWQDGESYNSYEYTPNNCGWSVTINGGSSLFNGTYGRCQFDYDDNMVYVAVKVISRGYYYQVYDLSTNNTAKIDYYLRLSKAPWDYVTYNEFNTYGNGNYEDKWNLTYADWVKTGNNLRPIGPLVDLEPGSDWCEEPTYDPNPRKTTGEGNWDSSGGQYPWAQNEIIKWDFEYCIDPTVTYPTP